MVGRSALALVLLCLGATAHAQEAPVEVANPRFPSLWGYGSIISMPNPALVGQTTFINVTVANPCCASANDVEVALSYNDWSISFGPHGWQEIGTQFVSLDAGDVAVLAFSYEFQSRAHTCLEAQIRSVGDGGNSNIIDDRAQVNMEVVYCSDECTYTIPIFNTNDHAITVGDLEFGCRIRERVNAEKDGGSTGLVDCPFDVQVDALSEDGSAAEPFSPIQMPKTSEANLRFSANLSSAPPVIDVYVQARDLATGELNHVVLRLVRSDALGMLNAPLFCCVRDLRARLSLERALAEALEAYERGAARRAVALLRRVVDRGAALECELEAESQCMGRALAMVAEGAKIIAAQVREPEPAAGRRGERARVGVQRGSSGDFMLRQGQYAASCLQYMQGLTDRAAAPEGAGVSPFAAPADAGVSPFDAGVSPFDAGVSPFNVQIAGSSAIRVSGGSLGIRDESVVVLQGGGSVSVSRGSFRWSGTSSGAAAASVSVEGGSLQLRDSAVLTFAGGSSIEVSGGSLRLSGDASVEEGPTTVEVVGGYLEMATALEQEGLAALHIGQAGVQLGGGFDALHIGQAGVQRMREVIALHIGQAGVEAESVAGVAWVPGVDWTADLLGGALRVRRSAGQVAVEGAELQLASGMAAWEGDVTLKRGVVQMAPGEAGGGEPLTVEGGTVVLQTESSLTVVGGSVEFADDSSAVLQGSDFKVVGGALLVTDVAQMAAGGVIITVKGGSFKLADSSEIEIAGGSIEVEGDAALSLESGAEVEIGGGELTFSGQARVAQLGRGSMTVLNTSEVAVTGGSVVLSQSAAVALSGSTIEFRPGAVVLSPEATLRLSLPGQPAEVWTHSVLGVSGGAWGIAGPRVLGGVQKSVDAYAPDNDGLKRRQSAELYSPYNDGLKGESVWNFHVWNEGFVAGGVRGAGSQWNFHVWTEAMYAGPLKPAAKNELDKLLGNGRR